jgi:DNA-binding transcriptional MocR family regulator
MHDGVYEKLKARLLAQIPMPGQTLQIGVVAEQLRVSSTPVREALTRLAAEGLIGFAPKKGFFARTPSELEIRGLYAANAALLYASIDQIPVDAGFGPAASPAPAVGEARSGALSVVLATDELFLRIGRHSGLTELSERIQNLSERLRHVRLIEHEVITDAGGELRRMRTHIEKAEYAELRAAVAAYHDIRLQNVSRICRELLVRAVSST